MEEEQPIIELSLYCPVSCWSDIIREVISPIMDEFLEKGIISYFNISFGSVRGDHICLEIYYLKGKNRILKIIQNKFEEFYIPDIGINNFDFNSNLFLRLPHKFILYGVRNTTIEYKYNSFELIKHNDNIKQLMTRVLINSLKGGTFNNNYKIVFMMYVHLNMKYNTNIMNKNNILNSIYSNLLKTDVCFENNYIKNKNVLINIQDKIKIDQCDTFEHEILKLVNAICDHIKTSNNFTSVESMDVNECTYLYNKTIAIIERLLNIKDDTRAEIFFYLNKLNDLQAEL